MESQIDFRTLPNNIPVLCIPRVYSNINESYIYRIFNDLNMGEIERIDIVPKTSEKGDKLNRVFIHFRKWNNSNNSIIARERLLNGKEIKIIYDDPWFWKISAYRVPERKPIIRLPNSEEIVVETGENKSANINKKNSRENYKNNKKYLHEKSFINNSHKNMNKRDDSHENPSQSNNILLVKY